ncbi:enoyl-[acyl-carrier protein] reductase II [Hathewaya proteolytica DSM 3090]|uniref:Probable nitronate monooxygenase n=1 Tax=Hathewaya proteolytica DSM 3090 TaxID=1121331 RepID=A0A1M6M206_9CLOT|nr:nitronate monooxygenase [Hathewaya proteolytica]SHJ77487.1 enoyl-[acyl-carrier protein] reductase II [Hathewaya proteolytica DSM 3090]
MRLNEILGIKYPIIQGGMANIATGEFAAAVSNTGALGIIGSGAMDGETLRTHIRACKERTDKPFGVNLMLMNPLSDDLARVIVEENVPVVTTGAGSPSKYIEQWKAQGIKIFPVVACVAQAIRMERYGVDGIIAEGTEAGGHVGELTTMTLIPQIVENVSLPVVAAGGIANGKQMLATRILGACGVQMGTALLVSEECPIHINYKNALIEAKDTDTMVTGRISGSPVRALKNSMTREYISLEKKGVTGVELEKIAIGGLKRAAFQGDVKNGSVMAGQVCGQLKEIKSLKEIFERITEEYKLELQKICGDE